MNYDTYLSRAGERMQQSAIRQMGAAAAERPDLISFAPGYPAPVTFAWEDYREICADLLRGGDGGVLQYGRTRGYHPLLGALSGILAQRGIEAGIDQILVTTGSQQGLDLISRVLLDPGDTVLVELPSYTGAITAFRNVQASLVGVRQETDGIDLAHLEEVIARAERQRRRPKFLYVVPNFQNPTGLLLALEKRLALLELAAKHDFLIVEDDPYGALYFEDHTTPAETRPMKADDRDGRVLYLSSFSKTLAPGFRTAWLVAPEPLAARFETAKQTLDLCTSVLDQHIVYEACRRGVLERQIPRLRAYYQRSRDVMEQALSERLGERARWTPPRGGFFLWIALADHVNTHDLLPRAMAHGVIYVAGDAFFVDGSGAHTLRLAFSLAPPEHIVEGVGRLAAAINEALAAAPVEARPLEA